MYLRVFLSFISLFLAVSAIAQLPVPDEEAQRGYLIGPGDEITGKVLGEADFDFVATVDENGKIEVPFFETPIVAKCLTERDLRAEVTKLLTKYLKSPQLSLRVTQRNSRPPVSVVGEIRQPQRFDLTRRVHLLELLSYAGGETEKSGGTIQVFRTRPRMCGESGYGDDWKVAADSSIGVPSKVFTLADLRQGTAEANPEILPGDIIYLAQASPIWVVGEVNKPGEVGMPEGGLPLTQAIAMAHGITREAKSKNVKVYRRQSNSPQPEVIAVNYDAIKKGEQKDIILQPFDIVEVDKSKKSIGEILLEAATGIPSRIPIPIRPL